MLVYFITRFSIFDINYKGFILTRNATSIEKYKSTLFSEKRLQYKFESFEKITLPGIVNQTNSNYIWEIYASTYLPIKYKKRLLEITKKYKQIKIFFIDSFENFNNSDKINDKYCTVRLDDDDGLNINYVEIIQKYKNENNTIISFSYGKLCTINEGKIIYGKEIMKKNNAQGLCAIGMNIHDCGDHTKVGRKYKVIDDSTPFMYLLNCSVFCDTKRIFKK